jgi:hypothetical protein
MKFIYKTLILSVFVIFIAMTGIVFSQSDTLVIYKTNGQISRNPLSNISKMGYVPSLAYPTNLHAIVIEKQKVVLAWNSVSGATNYRLYRSISTNGVYTQIYWASTPAYEDAGEYLSPATKYYYKVRAENNTTISDFSDAFEVTTLDSNSQSPVYPMIRPQKITVSKTNWYPQDVIQVNLTTYNAGEADVENYNVSLLLTKNEEKIDQTVVELQKNIAIVNHNQGELKNTTVNVTVPGNINGQYHIAAQVDPDMEVYQEDRSKTIKISDEIISISTNASKADLTGKLYQTPVEWMQNAELAVKLNVSNNGDLNVTEFKTQAYLSTDKIINKDDIKIGSEVLWGTLIAGQSVDKSVNITIGNIITPGEYFLGIIIDPDNLVSESNENNNFMYSDPIQVLSSEQTVTISGKITKINNLIDNYLQGVKFKSVDGMQGTIITDYYGNYEIKVPKGWSGKIEPVLTGYVFMVDCYSASSAIGYYQYDNLQTNKTIQDFQAVDIKKSVDDIAKIAKIIPEGMVDEIVSDKDLVLIKKGADLYNLFNEIKTVYGFLKADKDEINYYFDVGEYILGKFGPVGMIASTYCNLASSIIDIIKSSIVPNIRLQNMKMLPYIEENLTVNVTIKEEGFFFDQTIQSSEYTKNVSAELQLYLRANSSSALQISQYMPFEKKEDWSFNSGKLSLKYGTLKKHPESVVSQPEQIISGGDEWVWIAKIDFKDIYGNLHQRFYIPLNGIEDPLDANGYNVTFVVDKTPDFNSGNYILNVKD